MSRSLTPAMGTLPVPASAAPPTTIRSEPVPWRRASLVGYLIIILFFGGFGGWAAIAPLGSAVIAMGSLRVDTARKTVQPAAAGVVAEILVREGQQVQAGDVLVRLDRVRAEAELEMVRNQYYAHRIQEARLLAERDRLPAIVFPDEILALRNDTNVANMVEAQSNVFHSRRSTLEGQTRILQERIAQTRTEIEAFRGQRESLVKQLGLIGRETAGVRELHDKGLERLPRLLALERNLVSLEGQISTTDASIARAQQRIGEMELQIIDLRQQFDRDVANELRAIGITVNDLRERRVIAEDTLKRLVITAPRSGKVVDLKIHTVGGVVGGGQVLMDIVPDDEELIVEARVNPRDIDNVVIGSDVQVRLTSFSQRYTHPIKASLFSVSADSVTDTATGQPYYRALIKLDKESQQTILPDVELTSGMPATALISVGERTLLTYWLSPLLQSFELALREP
ncbi:HlyD family type I secretion periplasmic adaptor subunit [Azospirillum halopraeferens]|uniref:HlyD family type I secretion periplasmic adaptor subunit n=1 Tax=Azospirillum halopraeferens TaxID=34010 RepID=UPI0004087436|nr:HlyD family type I secretion periplasmic adaptor subunit [Azospirillum halopraeferens]